jgi:hypothetical protein
MSASLSLNDRVIIKSNNDIYNNTTGVVTFFSSKYLRIFTSMNEDLLISLDPYDEQFEIVSMTVLNKSTTQSYIKHNGIVKKKYVRFYLKGASTMRLGYITNIDKDSQVVTITDLEDKTPYTLDLSNGISPDLPIYFIQYISSSKVPKQLRIARTKKQPQRPAAAEEEAGEAEGEEVGAGAEPVPEAQEEAPAMEEGYFDLGEFEEAVAPPPMEVDERYIIYNDEVQSADMIADLLLNKVKETEALDIASELIQLKNVRKKLNENERGYEFERHDENYKPIVGNYQEKKILPRWIRPVVNNSRILFDDNEDLNQITTNGLVMSQGEVMNTFKNNLMTGANYRVEEDRMMKTLAPTPQDIQLPFDVEVVFENTNQLGETDVIKSSGKKDEDAKIESATLVTQITDEPMKIVGFLSSFQQAINELKEKEYIPLCLITGDNDNYSPIDRNLEVTGIQQNRVSKLEKGEKYVFCIQEGDLGTQRGIILGGTILDIEDDKGEIEVEPINPVLKEKINRLRLDTRHLEVYEHGVENVHCIFSIMKKHSISHALDNLVTTQDIYLKMSPINEYSIVNSRLIFQYLELFSITRRELHFKNYELFKRVLQNNISNYETGIYDEVYELPEETQYPPLNELLFNDKFINSKEMKEAYPELKRMKTPTECIRYIEDNDPYLFTLLHAIIYHRQVYKKLEQSYTEQTSQQQILATKQQRLRAQITALEQQMELKMKATQNIKKEYTRMSQLKTDEKKDRITVDKKYDNTNRDLFDLIRSENPNASYEDQVKILQQKLLKIGMGDENGEVPPKVLQNHIMGGAVLEPGDKVIVKEKNVIQIFTYGEDHKFELDKETTTKPTNIEQDILHGEDDLESLSLQSLLDKSREIIDEDRRITQEIRQLQMEYEEQALNMITENILKKYSSHIRELEQTALEKAQHASYKKELEQNRRDFKYPEIDPDTDFYISKQEKEPVDVETLDTTDEYNRDGTLKVRRKADIREKPLVLPSTDYAKRYMFFIQVVQEIFEVEFSNEDIEMGFQVCTILEGQIPKGRKYKQAQKNVYMVCIFASALVFIFQGGSGEYTVSNSIGRCSFTQRGFPLEMAGEDENDKGAGIIRSLACFLKTLKIQIDQRNVDAAKDLIYIKPKVEVFEKTILKYVNAILASNPQIRNALKNRREKEQRKTRSVETTFKIYPVQRENNPKLVEVGRFPELSAVDRLGYITNEANIFLTADAILRDIIKRQDPILVNSKNVPYIGNSVSYYRGNQNETLSEVLNDRVLPLLDEIRRQSGFRFGGTSYYIINEKTVERREKNVDYRLPIAAIIRLAKKSNPSADLENIEFDRRFFQGLLRELRLRNLVPEPNYLEEEVTPSLGQPNMVPVATKEELYGEFMEQMGEIADNTIDDFRDDYILTENYIPDIFNSIVKSVFEIYLPRIITNKKQPTGEVKNMKDNEFISHVFKGKRLAREHRHSIELILRGRDLTDFYRILDEFQGEERQLLVEAFRGLTYPIKVTPLDFIKIVTDFLTTLEEDSDVKDITIRLILEGIKLVIKMMGILNKSKEELEEYMSSIIERERNMIISQDDKLKDDMDKRQLNKVQKALKLGVWALGARKGWDYTAELYEMEVQQLKEWEALQRGTGGEAEGVGAGDFTAGMMDERDRAQEDARVEREELQFEGMAEED